MKLEPYHNNKSLGTSMVNILVVAKVIFLQFNKSLLTYEVLKSPKVQSLNFYNFKLFL